MVFGLTLVIIYDLIVPYSELSTGAHVELDVMFDIIFDNVFDN